MTSVFGLLCETNLHVGAGRANGAIDLPVAKEAATQYPFVPGSGLKGALRDAVRLDRGEGAADTLFGVQENAGALLIGDARLLLLPVRSLTGAYKWVTSRHLLERYQRDAHRSGVGGSFLPPQPSEFGVLGDGSGTLFLEERSFTFEGGLPSEVTSLLAPLIKHEATRERLAAQVVIVHDDALNWFARYALDIRARNVLHPEKKTSKNLWYEESLPTDTLLYSVVANRPTSSEENALAQLHDYFQKQPYLQVGGNETVGQGWCAVTALEGAR